MVDYIKVFISPPKESTEVLKQHRQYWDLKQDSKIGSAASACAQMTVLYRPPESFNVNHQPLMANARNSSPIYISSKMAQILLHGKVNNFY
jgi:hypothetical protein